MANRILGLGIGLQPQVQMVKPASSIDQRIAELRQMLDNHHTTVRMSLGQARNLGEKLVALKNDCIENQTPWLEALRKTGIGEDAGQRYMLIFAYWTKLVSHSAFSRETGLGESLIIIANIRQVEADKALKETGKNGTASKFCPACQEKGPKRDCADCYNLNHPGREPGDEEAPKKPKKTGQPVFAWTKVESPFGSLVRSLDALGRAYDCKEDPRLQEIRNELESAFRHIKALLKRVSKEEVPE
jgi:hypothetical protein